MIFNVGAVTCAERHRDRWNRVAPTEETCLAKFVTCVKKRSTELQFVIDQQQQIKLCKCKSRRVQFHPQQGRQTWQQWWSGVMMRSKGAVQSSSKVKETSEARLWQGRPAKAMCKAVQVKPGLCERPQAMGSVKERCRKGVGTDRQTDWRERTVLQSTKLEWQRPLSLLTLEMEWEELGFAPLDFCLAWSRMFSLFPNSCFL